MICPLKRIKIQADRQHVCKRAQLYLLYYIDLNLWIVTLCFIHNLIRAHSLQIGVKIVIYYFHVYNGIFKICNVYNHAKSLFTTRVVAYLIVNVHVLNYQSYLLLGVVTYSRVSRHWEVFFFQKSFMGVCTSNCPLDVHKVWKNSSTALSRHFGKIFFSVKNILKTE